MISFILLAPRTLTDRQFIISPFIKPNSIPSFRTILICEDMGLLISRCLNERAHGISVISQMAFLIPMMATFTKPNIFIYRHNQRLREQQCSSEEPVAFTKRPKRQSLWQSSDSQKRIYNLMKPGKKCSITRQSR